MFIDSNFLCILTPKYFSLLYFYFHRSSTFKLTYLRGNSTVHTGVIRTLCKRDANLQRSCTRVLFNVFITEVTLHTICLSYCIHINTNVVRKIIELIVAISLSCTCVFNVCCQYYLCLFWIWFVFCLLRLFTQISQGPMRLNCTRIDTTLPNYLMFSTWA